MEYEAEDTHTACWIMCHIFLKAYGTWNDATKELTVGTSISEDFCSGNIKWSAYEGNYHLRFIF